MLRSAAARAHDVLSSSSCAGRLRPALVHDMTSIRWAAGPSQPVLYQRSAASTSAATGVRATRSAIARSTVGEHSHRASGARPGGARPVSTAPWPRRDTRAGTRSATASVTRWQETVNARSSSRYRQSSSNSGPGSTLAASHARSAPCAATPQAVPNPDISSSAAAASRSTAAVRPGARAAAMATDREYPIDPPWWASMACWATIIQSSAEALVSCAARASTSGVRGPNRPSGSHDGVCGSSQPGAVARARPDTRWSYAAAASASSAAVNGRGGPTGGRRSSHSMGSTATSPAAKASTSSAATGSPTVNRASTSPSSYDSVHVSPTASRPSSSRQAISLRSPQVSRWLNFQSKPGSSPCDGRAHRCSSGTPALARPAV